jgi:puromycin-sensitive aminopeptidase
VTQDPRYRLPRTVTPAAYDLVFRIDPADTTYTGSARIAVTVHEPVREIVLNAVDLAVHSAITVTRVVDGATVQASGVEPDLETQRVTFTFLTALGIGEHVIELTFDGLINDRMLGFYRSHYPTASGANANVVATQFAATDARRAFPCWDEPDLKATYAVTLVVPVGDLALANTPEIAREPADAGFVRVTFARSMVMSTYLLAIVVGPMAVSEPRMAGGVPVRTVSRPDRLSMTDYPGEVGVFTLDWYASYYDRPYPEQKSDQVALPDFAQGAMENTGLVVYRETLLLLDPATATPDERRRVAEVIAHENAHMWFGDLVTMRWWNGIWLNEAFATFMSFLCVDAMEPTWKVFDAVLTSRVRAFEVDSLATTRPIEFPVGSPDEANGMFDILTYTKGGAVLRMIEQWLGPETFRDGIRRYLATHAFGNTETHDLWDALAAASGEPVRRVAEPWVFQPGYPSVFVRLDGDVIRLTQHRFAPSMPDDASTWPIPLTVRQVSPDGEIVERVVVEAEGLDLPLAHRDALVVVNAGSTAYVRTLYDDDLRARLIARARTDLSPAERLSLVDDAWATVVAGGTSMDSYLELAFGFSEETSPPVWQTLLAGLDWVDRFVEGAGRERFREEVRALVRPTLLRLGWDVRAVDTPEDLELRGDMIRAMGILGDDRETQAMAREDEAQVRAGHPVDPAVASAAIDVVAFVGDARDYDTFVQRMEEATTPQDQDRYRFALPTFRDPELLERTLELVVSGAIRAQDGPFILQVALMNRDLGDAAWAYVRDNWASLTSLFAVPNIIAIAQGARWLSDADGAADVQAFFALHDIPQNHRTLTQAMERQRLYADLRARVSDDLATRFS